VFSEHEILPVIILKHPDIYFRSIYFRSLANSSWYFISHSCCKICNN